MVCDGSSRNCMKNKPLIAQKSLSPRAPQLESRCNLSDDEWANKITVLGRIIVRLISFRSQNKDCRVGRLLLGARQAVLRLDVRWEHLALAHLFNLFTDSWEAHPSHVLPCALPLWGREMAPHPLLIASLRWMCFSKGKALAQPVNLGDIWMLMLQRNKNEGTNWE